MGYYEPQRLSEYDLDLANDEDIYDYLDETEDDYDEYDFDTDDDPAAYRSYVPDYMSDLAPLSAKTKLHAWRAQAALDKAAQGALFANEKSGVAWLLLRSESVSSTRIEGYQATMQSLIEYEALQKASAKIVPHRDEQIALDAVNVMRDIITSPRKALTVDDLCDIDDRMTQTDAGHRFTGKLRDRPVFIGSASDTIQTARYVPPSADRVEDLMDDLVGFINENMQAPAGEIQTDIPPVALAALAHAQLVTIHPFTDGNGRTSRALMQMILHNAGVSPNTVAPVSCVLLSDRDKYIDALETFRNPHGPSNPNDFVNYVSAACERTAQSMMKFERELGETEDAWHSLLGNKNQASKKILETIPTMPICTVNLMAETTGLSSAQCAEILNDMTEARILSKHNTKIAPQTTLYVADDILDAIEEQETLLLSPTRQHKHKNRIDPAMDFLLTQTDVDNSFV